MTKQTKHLSSYLLQLPGICCLLLSIKLFKTLGTQCGQQINHPCEEKLNKLQCFNLRILFSYIYTELSKGGKLSLKMAMTNQSSERIYHKNYRDKKFWKAIKRRVENVRGGARKSKFSISVHIFKAEEISAYILEKVTF